MRRIASLLTVLAIAGCGAGERGAPEEAAAATGNGREELLGPFLAAHWQLPVPAQGPAPEGWTPLESSLAPESCGACHPQQLADWSRSLHAGAYSPGFAGQLIEGALSDPAEVRACQTCHAPLEEQQPWNAAGAPNPHADEALRAQGIVCASCHVREHRRYGPPRREGVAAAPEPAPHGGFEVRSEYQQARFCATCHQFFDDAGVNGKPVENTFVEWRESPHAARGETCQSCHMPDRRHLWRGIHDPEMVRGATEVELAPGALAGPRLEATLVLHSHGVGHRFPSYVTPRVFLDLWQVDAAGAELEGTRDRSVIGRELDFSTEPWGEVFDTRIAPGGSARLDYAEPRHPAAAALVGRVLVDPDFHYRDVFRELADAYESPEARAAIQEAYRRTTESSYVLGEVRRPLPGAAGG